MQTHPEPAQSEAPSQADASSTGDASEPEQTGKKELTGTFEVALFSAKEATDTYWNELLDAFQAEYPDLEIKRIISPVIGDEIRPRWVDNTRPT